MIKHIYKILILISIFVTGISQLYLPVLAQQTATSEADSVRDKVKQKVEEARKNPKAFIGVITDKTESGLQIRLESGEISQISVSSATTYVKVDKSSIKINYSEVAIGDYIVAMGYKDSNNVLEAKRILLYAGPPSNTKRLVLYAVVTDITKTQLTVLDKNGATYYIKPGTDIVVTTEGSGGSKKSKYAAIADNDTIVAIGDTTNSLLEARRIYLYTNKANTSPTPTVKVKASPTPTIKAKSTATPSPAP